MGMNIRKGFLLSEIDDTGVVVATGKLSRTFNSMITLNTSGIFLWRILEKGATEKELENALISEYGIDEATAKEDLKGFLNTLKGADIIENC
jgi:hypothetical protein